MEIVATFVQGLYSIKYEETYADELERLLDEWVNPLYLDTFFCDNQADLNEISIEEAINQVYDEAKRLRQFLTQLKSKRNSHLDSLFQPLSPTYTSPRPLEKSKAKRRWLRLYAIKIDTKERENNKLPILGWQF